MRDKSNIEKFSHKNIVDGEERVTENIYLYNNSCEDIQKLLSETFDKSLKISSLSKKIPLSSLEKRISLEVLKLLFKS